MSILDRMCDICHRPVLVGSRVVDGAFVSDGMGGLFHHSCFRAEAIAMGQKLGKEEAYKEMKTTPPKPKTEEKQADRFSLIEID